MPPRLWKLAHCRRDVWFGAIGGHEYTPSALRLLSPSVEPLRGCFWRFALVGEENGTNKR